VLFARDRDFGPYRVLGANGKPLTEVAGFFSRRETWAVAGLAGTSSQDVRRIIFNEGVHWLFSAYQRPNPVWVEEGVAEVFSTFAFARKKMSWGHGIEEHAFVFQRGPLIPLERLMFLDKAMMFRGGGPPVGMLYAQSWAFAHYLLFGQHSLPKDALDTDLKLYHSAIHPDEAFKRAFGTTYADEAMGMTFTGSYRSQQLRQRRDFQALEHFEAARLALEAADHAEARRLAEAIIASEASNSIKASARQILQHLDRAGVNPRPRPSP
jgi:hypothetical protein